MVGGIHTTAGLLFVGYVTAHVLECVAPVLGCTGLMHVAEGGRTHGDDGHRG